MAQELNSTNTHANSGNNKQKHNSKRPNKPFQKQTQKSTAPTQQGGRKQSRDEKRRRWAKKHKVAPKVVAKLREPVKEYISACCNLRASKPRAGEKVITRDPETGKPKETRLGLGHWRCSGCSKSTKVSPRKPKVEEVPVVAAV